jgi:hypothetical protein
LAVGSGQDPDLALHKYGRHVLQQKLEVKRLRNRQITPRKPLSMAAVLPPMSAFATHYATSAQVTGSGGIFGGVLVQR